MCDIRGYHVATFYQQKLYVIGGVTPVLNEAGEQREFPANKEYASCMTVNVYDAHTKEWNYLKTTGVEVSALENSSSCCYDDKIYIFGGWTGHTHSNEILVLNLTSLLWKKVSSVTMTPSPRAGCSMNVTSERQFLLFGGQGPVAVSNNTSRSEPRAVNNNNGTMSVVIPFNKELGSETDDSNTQPTNMSNSRDLKDDNNEKKQEAATYDIEKTEFPMATFISSNKYSNDVFNNQLFFYDPNTCIWSSISDKMTDGPSPRAYHSGVTLRHFVYIYGGRNSTKRKF